MESSSAGDAAAPGLQLSISNRTGEVMTRELDTLSSPLTYPLGDARDFLEALSPALRRHRLRYYAPRNLLRTPQALVLCRWVGVALAMTAWIVLLLGLAHLFLAAVRNYEGELGLGLDQTLTGARACGLSALLGAVGVPLWVRAEGRIRRGRAPGPIDA